MQKLEKYKDKLLKNFKFAYIKIIPNNKCEYKQCHLCSNDYDHIINCKDDKNYSSLDPDKLEIFLDNCYNDCRYFILTPANSSLLINKEFNNKYLDLFLKYFKDNKIFENKSR